LASELARVLSLQLAHLAKLNLNILSALARFQPNKSRYQKLLAKKFAMKQALCGARATRDSGRIPLFVPSALALRVSLFPPAYAEMEAERV
jgi:hypothetical protein